MLSPMYFLFQLVIGDFGLSPDQQRLQMAIWSIMAAPMFISADVRTMPLESKAILQNKLAIAISQDPLGAMGTQVAVVGFTFAFCRYYKSRGYSGFSTVTPPPLLLQQRFAVKTICDNVNNLSKVFTHSFVKYNIKFESCRTKGTLGIVPL